MTGSASAGVHSMANMPSSHTLQGADDGPNGTTTEDPPDTRSSHQKAPSDGHFGATSPPMAIIDPRRISYDAKASSPLISFSPSMTDSGRTESVSDYDREHEHELDSPSSLSSWNSWAGGRRGDLADVEDFELEAPHEPELETVSELDEEESSGFHSGSDRINGMLDSDDDARAAGKSSSTSTPQNDSPRRRQNRLSDHFTGLHISHSSHNSHPTATHTGHGSHTHYASHLHPHGTPSYPHFSPRAGGHGLSHHSRFLQRAPPNVAARRRKGRLAELAEEGGGASDAIKTTTMPAIPTTPRAGPVPDGDVPPVPSAGSDLSSRSESGTDFSTPRDEMDLRSLNVAPPSMVDDGGALTPMPHHRGEYEIFGPPAPPVRCVSPSETIPVVPSPLCECVTAPEDEANAATETEAAAVDGVPACETPREERSMTPTLLEESTNIAASQIGDATIRARASSSSSPPSPTTSGLSLDYSANRSTPPSTPPSSPLASRIHAQGRRLSSPTHGRSKPLRPCFKRGNSTQTSSRTQSSRDSSTERDGTRGRTKVRFSPAPPLEVRTHSPVDYDRKACPVNNRLSADDLEELRGMKMEMGLLEAKCAALAAAKHDDPHGSHAESESETEQCMAKWTAHANAKLSAGHAEGPRDRKRADSITSSSPSTFCANRFAERSKGAPSPADYLRMEREKERERVLRMAGIGTGAGFRYTGGSGRPNLRQMPHGGCETLGASITSRWGLNKPPPPLPGLPASVPTSPSWSPGPSYHNRTSHNDFQSHVGPQPPSQASLSPTMAASAQMRPSSTPPATSARSEQSVDVLGSMLSSPAKTSAVPDTTALEEIAEAQELNDQVPDEPRGRSAVKGMNGRRQGHNDSASTDATITQSTASLATQRGEDAVKEHAADEKTDLPSLVHTAPSPETSPVRPHSRSRSPVDERLRKMYAHNVAIMQSQQHQRQSPSYSQRSGSPHASPVKSIDAISPRPPPITSMPSRPSFGCSGYDSPASEFYESGSEYDLVG